MSRPSTLPVPTGRKSTGPAILSRPGHVSNALPSPIPHRRRRAIRCLPPLLRRRSDKGARCELLDDELSEAGVCCDTVDRLNVCVVPAHTIRRVLTSKRLVATLATSYGVISSTGRNRDSP